MISQETIILKIKNYEHIIETSWTVVKNATDNKDLLGVESQLLKIRQAVIAIAAYRGLLE